MGSHYSHLRLEERRKLANWLEAKMPIAEMARVLKRHKPTIFREIKLPFTPTSASCLNMVKRFFVEITSKRVRCRSYSIVDDLETAIYDILVREQRALNAPNEIRGNRQHASDSEHQMRFKTTKLHPGLSKGIAKFAT